jgi:hypothetical protein
MPDAEMHAVAKRFGKEGWIIVTGRSRAVRYLLERGPMGDHVRWMNRNDAGRRELWGIETVIPGPWPMGLRLPGFPNITFVRPGVLSEAGGLALTAWIILRVLRG